MCGIFGLVNQKGEIDLNFLTRHRDLLSHRGPDDAGCWLDKSGRIGLAHRRLSIVDLSIAGHQPMLSKDARLAIVFNGEIYNYLEIRKELSATGYAFSTASDTEVLLAAYITWGESCLRRLNGMFAFAIYDSGDIKRPESIFFARDRIGKKPLYISLHKNGLAFASELKAIPSSMRGALSLRALNFYLALGYIPHDLCIVEGVSKLPPAYAARYLIDTGQLKTWCWWSAPQLQEHKYQNIEELVDEVEDLISDSVKIRLRSDVPVGIMLSGGLDSSIVTVAATQAVSHVKTFTLGLPGSKLDETSYAYSVAKHFSTEHHVLALPDACLDSLEEIASLIDEPLADSSMIPTYLLSKLTVGHVKVALGGDGGDELFGGYSHYTKAMRDFSRLGWIPNQIFKFAAQAAGALPTGVRGRNRIYSLLAGPHESLVWGTPYFDAIARRRILSPNVVDFLGTDFMAPELFRLGLYKQGIDPVDRMTRTDFGSILPDDFLVKIDRASMAVGLEMRSPLLDYRLMEMAFGRIPSKWKVLGNDGRRLQKLIGKRLLPPELNLERKQGFSIPINEWTRSQSFINKSGNLFGIDKSILNQEEVRNQIYGHARGRANGGRVYSLYVLSQALNNLKIAT
jgi:asparagine synthase (glutamine-hydrolysing)